MKKQSETTLLFKGLVSMKEYQAELITKGVTYCGTVVDDGDLLTMEVEGLSFDLDYFDNQLVCLEEELDLSVVSHLDLMPVYPFADKSRPLYLLANFSLKVMIPVPVKDNTTNLTLMDALEIRVAHTEERLSFTYSILGKAVENRDIDDGLHQLGVELFPEHALILCGCCKFGSWNPYGGSPFINYLCVKGADGLEGSYITRNKGDLVELWERKKLKRQVIIARCPDYISRY